MHAVMMVAGEGKGRLGSAEAQPPSSSEEAAALQNPQEKKKKQTILRWEVYPLHSLH